MQVTESLTALEVLATIICESGGARFLKLERVKGYPALVVFCTGEVIAALPLDQMSTRNVKHAVQGEAVDVETTFMYSRPTSIDSEARSTKCLP